MNSPENDHAVHFRAKRGQERRKHYEEVRVQKDFLRAVVCHAETQVPGEDSSRSFLVREENAVALAHPAAAKTSPEEIRSSYKTNHEKKA